MRTKLAVALVLMVFAPPALSQENPFTPEDDALLSGCIAKLANDPGAPPQAPALPSGDPDNPSAAADCIGAASSVCMDTPDGSTTIGISECMARETDWWDTRLNATYQDLRETLDAESFAALQTAQKHWITFRDADCEFQYTRWRDGTIRSTYYSSCLLDATATRAISLSDYADWGAY